MDFDKLNRANEINEMFLEIDTEIARATGFNGNPFGFTDRPELSEAVAEFRTKAVEILRAKKRDLMKEFADL